MRNVSGPKRSGGSVTASVRFYDRLRSGGVAPGDLALDPNYHPGRAKVDLGADLRRLQVNVDRNNRR
jgi:hypothetical protein